MIEFALPWILAALPLPLIMRLLPKTHSAANASLRVPSQWLSRGPIARQQTRKISPWFAALVWVLLVIAAARPQWLGEPIPIPADGREMMLAVDLSGSMEAKDMQINNQAVNRLDMLKYVLNDFIDRRVGDRLGLILFADSAYMQAPMTYDRKTVNQLLDEAVLGLVGEKTAIGDAIGLAVKRFHDKKEGNNVLILITDGQNTAGNITPEQALKLAKRYKVTIYTIGVGADSMLVRSIFGQRKVNPSAELDETMLSKLATETGGQYFRARDTESLVQIYELLDKLEPVADDAQQFRPLQALFYWPLGAAFILTWLPFLPRLHRFRRDKDAS